MKCCIPFLHLNGFYLDFFRRRCAPRRPFLVSRRRVSDPPTTLTVMPVHPTHMWHTCTPIHQHRSTGSIYAKRKSQIFMIIEFRVSVPLLCARWLLPLAPAPLLSPKSGCFAVWKVYIWYIRKFDKCKRRVQSTRRLVSASPLKSRTLKNNYCYCFRLTQNGPPIHPGSP